MSNARPPIGKKTGIKVGRQGDNQWHNLDDPCGHAPDEFDERGTVTLEIRCGGSDMAGDQLQAEIDQTTNGIDPEIEDFCVNWYNYNRLCNQ